MKKKKKNAPVAEAKTPKNDSLVAASEDVHQDQAETLDVPVVPFDLSKVDPSKLALAEEMGIPITELINWAMSVEKRFQIIGRDVALAPQKVVEALKAEALKGERERAATMAKVGAAAQESRASGLAGILQTVRDTGVLRGGGSMDEEMSGLMKEMFHLNINRMKQDMTNSMMTAQADADLSKTLKEALAKEFAKKTAARIME